MSVGLSKATSNKNTLAPNKGASVSLLVTVPLILLADRRVKYEIRTINILKL